MDKDYLQNLGTISDLNDVTKTSICMTTSSTLHRPTEHDANLPVISIFGLTDLPWGSFVMGIQICIINSSYANTSYYRVKYADQWYTWGLL